MLRLNPDLLAVKEPGHIGIFKIITFLRKERNHLWNKMKINMMNQTAEKLPF